MAYAWSYAQGIHMLQVILQATLIFPSAADNDVAGNLQHSGSPHVVNADAPL